jgi:putative Ca2+/H+ antiporter (TMEM165/GDT1 family)
MFAEALGAAFGLTFIAEMGDKTQIAILNLSARFGIWQVFLGAAIAFAVLDAAAVVVGEVLYKLIPHDAVRYIAAGIFIVFGILSLVHSGDEERKTKTSRNPVLTTIAIIALMELGDKTQLSLVALTARYSSPVAVFIGGTAALWITALVGAVVGEAIGRVLPFKWIRIGSGVVFIIFGVLLAVGVI